MHACTGMPYWTQNPGANQGLALSQPPQDPPFPWPLLIVLAIPLCLMIVTGVWLSVKRIEV